MAMGEELLLVCMRTRPRARHDAAANAVRLTQVNESSDEDEDERRQHSHNRMISVSTPTVEE